MSLRCRWSQLSPAQALDCGCVISARIVDSVEALVTVEAMGAEAIRAAVAVAVVVTGLRLGEWAEEGGTGRATSLIGVTLACQRSPAAIAARPQGLEAAMGPQRRRSLAPTTFDRRGPVMVAVAVAEPLSPRPFSRLSSHQLCPLQRRALSLYPMRFGARRERLLDSC